MNLPTDRPLKLAIAYTRVSTKKQADDGNGHELQMVRIRAFARVQSYRIVQTFSDAETGMGEESIRDRKGVVAAIKLSREEGIPIIVDGLSRFARNTSALEDAILRKGLKVISCQSGEGAAHAVVMAEAERAQAEGELISRSTRVALQKLKQQGVLLGNRTNLDEAQRKGAEAGKARARRHARDLAPVIRELRVDGRTTARSIAEGLNTRGIRTTRGEDWNAGNVRRLLERVSELEEAQEQAENLENPDWGTW